MIGTGIGLGLSGYRLKTGSFNPSWISGLQLWLDASDASTLYQSSGGSAATADGDPVGYWADKSGNARDAVQASGTNKPTLKLGVKNSRNTLLFDGTNDSLSVSGSASSLKFLHSADSTVFAVFKYNTLNGGAIIDSMAGTTAKTGVYVYATTTGKWQTLLGNSSSAANTSPVFNESANSYIPTDFVLGSFTNRPTNATASLRSYGYKNGGNSFNNNAATGVASTASSSHDLTIGCFFGGSGSINGYLCELIVYNSALTDSDKNIVDTYLNSKWSIY